MDMQQIARENLMRLSQNLYPGRGIVVGLDETGECLVQVYWIMGRRENSRNRVFECDRETGRVYTEAADPSKVKDPSLIIYNAMRETRFPTLGKMGHVVAVVSNGAQTDAAVTGIESGKTLLESLRDYDYEPDDPIFTPRITASSVWQWKGVGSYHPTAEIALLRKAANSRLSDRNLYTYVALQAGFGHCITTYQGDGEPPPAFEGEPCLVPLAGDAGQIAHAYLSALDGPNFVALAVKFIPQHGRSEIVIVNTRTKVSQSVASPA